MLALACVFTLILEYQLAITFSALAVSVALPLNWYLKYASAILFMLLRETPVVKRLLKPKSKPKRI